MLNPSKWVSLYGDYLFSIAMLKTSNRENAEDLVQETFLAAVKGQENFRSESSEKTWLVSILNHKIIDFYRKKEQLKNVNVYLLETQDSFDEQVFGSSSKPHWTEKIGPKAWKSDPESEYEQEEFYRIMSYCMQKLPPKMVPVFVSKFMDDLESEEICKEFEISSSNYWVIIHRTKILIRACLEKNWFSKA